MRRKIGIVIALCGMVAGAQAQTQSSLGALAAEAGVDWLVGDWQGETDSGDTITLAFKADLDKHLGTVHYKDRRTESKGIVILDPASGEAKYFAGNNQGGFGAGVWTAEDKKAILKYKHTAADGKITKLGMTFAKVNADTMEVKIFELSDKDELGADARYTRTFKRKK